MLRNAVRPAEAIAFINVNEGEGTDSWSKPEGVRDAYSWWQCRLPVKGWS